MAILGYLKNTHKNPKFGRVRQVPTRELGWEFPGWDLSHFAKFGIFKYPKMSKNGNLLLFSCVLLLGSSSVSRLPYREGSGLLAQVLADNIAAILFSIQPAGFQSLKMENLRKDYRARVREDLLTEAASDTNKVKFFQEQFQVSQGGRLIVRDT